LKTPIVRLRKSLRDEVHRKLLACGADESVAFLTAKHFATDEKDIFIADSIVPVKPGDYLRQGPLHLKVSPLYVSRVLNTAEDQKNTVIMAHSHPFEKEIPDYSPSDTYGEALTSETISKCLPENPPVASLVFGEHHLNARGWSGLSQKFSSAAVATMESGYFRFQSHSPSKKGGRYQESLHRQVKALGQSFQQQLEGMDIGVVGLGGTGSAVAEQLARMGANKLRLVDHDKLEPSNLSRVCGSKQRDVLKKRAKVEVVASYLKEINPTIEVKTLKQSVMTRSALQWLANCDFVFSCLDRHAPRAVVNELSYQCFIPIIDVGIGIRRQTDGSVTGAARATLIGPLLPCLVCQEIVRPEMITAENLSPEEFEKRKAEGYVAPFEQQAASVVTYTSLAACLGVKKFIEALSSAGTDNYSTLIFDFQTDEIYHLTQQARQECVCQKRLGKGFSIPFSVAD
jgi:hypothetical protein